MKNFIEIIKNVLNEQGKTLQDLFDKKIVSPNTFYKYKQRNPSLRTLKNIANYLKVSIDYLFEMSLENNFREYPEEDNFYINFNKYQNAQKISGRQLCKELNYSKDNIKRWEKGISPNIQTLLEIAKYFDCTIDDLLLK